MSSKARKIMKQTRELLFNEMTKTIFGSICLSLNMLNPDKSASKMYNWLRANLDESSSVTISSVVEQLTEEFSLDKDRNKYLSLLFDKTERLKPMVVVEIEDGRIAPYAPGQYSVIAHRWNRGDENITKERLF